jgi:amino acid adenylation domain-containing protein
MNLLNAVLRWAREDPDAVAVIAADGTCTYRQLLVRAERYAKAYERCGVRPGDRVAVVLEPGREAIAAYVAAFIIRAAYVPLTPDQAPVRALRMLRNCAPRLCVGVPAVGWEDAALSTPASLAGDSWPEANCGMPTLDAVLGADEDVAYVMHTSGSTGFPKGVEIEHAGVCNLLADLDRRAPLGRGEIGSWWASPEFDAAIMECWGPLYSGGTVTVMPAADRWEAGSFADFLGQNAVTSAFVPPSYLAGLLDYFCSQPGAGHELRRLITGAGPVRLGLLQDMMCERPGLVVINAYGPAETTVCATLYTVPRTGGDPSSRTPIGHAVDGFTLTITGPDGKASPGGEGELVVAGIGVGRGYIGAGSDPDGRFSLPPAGHTGTRSYRTGDRVRLLPEGELLFLGRNDRQLKVRGYRIEPAEIETSVREAAAVREVVIDQRAVPGRGDVIVAYVVADGDAFDPEAARRALQCLLPAWAIPAFFVVLPRLPLTSNGKVDHAELSKRPLLDDAPVPKASEPYQPGGELQVVLAAWQGELGGAVSDDIGFAALGGSSLPAVRVANQLRAVTGKIVSAADVLTARTARELASMLAAAPVAEGGSGPAPTGSLEGALSPAQQGLWIHDQLDGTGLAYVEPLAYVLPRQVDFSRLSDALTRTVSAHPALGATTQRSGGMIQLQLAEHRIRLERLDGEAADFMLAPFRVEGGPLMRAAVLSRDHEPDLLIFVWHHLVMDGWSVRLFLACLERCYADLAFRPQQPAATLCDANAWLWRQAEGPDAASAADKALAYLDGVRLPELGTERPGRGRALTINLGNEVSSRLLDASKRTGLTVSTYLLTAYQHALIQFFDLDNSILGCAVARRIRPELQDIIGHFADTVLVRIQNRRDAPSVDTAWRIEADFMHARALQEEISFGHLVAAWRKSRHDLPLRVPRVYFSFDDGYKLTLADNRCESYPVSVQRTMFDASLVLEWGTNGVRGEFQHSLGLLDEEAAAKLVQIFTEVISALV